MEQRCQLLRYLVPLTIAAAVLAPALAGAQTQPVQTPGSNVNVTECHVQLEKPQLRIGFTNQAKTTVTEIDFTIVTAVGVIQTVKDVGHFATGVGVSHNFAIPDGTSPLGFSSAHCVVSRLVYDDGTTWNGPSR